MYVHQQVNLEGLFIDWVSSSLWHELLLDTCMRPCFIDFSSFCTIQEDDEDSSAGEEDVVSESSFIKNSDSFNLSSPKVLSPSVILF